MDWLITYLREDSLSISVSLGTAWPPPKSNFISYDNDLTPGPASHALIIFGHQEQPHTLVGNSIPFHHIPIFL